MRKLAVKKIAVIIFVILLCFMAITPVYAQLDAPEKDEGGMFDRAIAAVIQALIIPLEGLFEWGGFKQIDQLVFMDGYSEEELRIHPWTEKEKEMIDNWYKALVVVTAPFFIVVIAVTAFRFFHGAVNPAARAEAKESILRWFLAVGIVALAPILASTVIYLCVLLVDAIQGAWNEVASAAGFDRATGDWANFEVAGMNIVTGSVLGTTLVQLAFVLFFVYLNILYLLRKLALTVLICFSPIMALFWAIKKDVAAVGIWLGELASNAFMPVAHALVLCTILLIVDVEAAGDGSWLTILILLYGLIPLSEVLRNSMQDILTRWAGFDEAKSARGAMAAITGIAAISGLAKVASATFGKRPNPVDEVKGSDIKHKPERISPPMPSVKIPVDSSGGVNKRGVNKQSIRQGYEKMKEYWNSPRMQKAKHIGSVVGSAAGTATEVGANIIGGVVPGGQKVVQSTVPIVKKTVGFVTGASYLAGSWVKQRLVLQKTPKLLKDETKSLPSRKTVLSLPKESNGENNIQGTIPPVPKRMKEQSKPQSSGRIVPPLPKGSGMQRTIPPVPRVLKGKSKSAPTGRTVPPLPKRNGMQREIPPVPKRMKEQSKPQSSGRMVPPLPKGSSVQRTIPPVPKMLKEQPKLANIPPKPKYPPPPKNPKK